MSISQALDRPEVSAEAVDPGDTPALILHTAAKLFMQEGYAAVSMSQIVEEVSKVRKLSKPAIYYHFTDKEALFMAVLLDSLERCGQAITAASATEGDLATRVAALVRALPNGQSIMISFRSAFSELDGKSRERFMRARHEYLFAPLVEAFERIAARGELRPSMSPSIAATALIGITHTLAFSEALAGTGSDVATVAADLLLNGIAAREGGRRGPPETDPTG
jgi:AcrR family transcriptional regulator